MKNLKGAIVDCMGIKAKIEKVLYAEYWDRYGWDIEFIDTAGHYRHWKQYEDGGELKYPMPKSFIVGETAGAYYDDNGKKHLLDYYGGDCTDLFEKYGYKM